MWDADFMAASGMAGQSQVSSGLVQQPAMANNPTVYSYNSTAALQQQQQQQYAAQQQLTLQNQVNSLKILKLLFIFLFAPFTLSLSELFVRYSLFIAHTLPRSPCMGYSNSHKLLLCIEIYIKLLMYSVELEL